MNVQKKISVYLSLIALLFLCSCSNERKDAPYAVQVLNVDVSDAHALEYKNLFKKSKLIPLSTNEQSLIGQISKLYITDSFIVIFDKKQMAILLFDIEGDFIRKIGQKGSGPNEYLTFNDIQLDEENSLIYAHERFKNSIFVYHINGSLVSKSPKIPVSFNSFCKTKNGYWVYSCFKNESNPEGKNLMLLDSGLSKVKASFFPQKLFVNASDEPTFTRNEQGIPFFFFPSGNIIYKLDKELPVPVFQVEFGNKTMPYEKIRGINSYEEYDKLVAGKKYLGDISNFKIGDNIAYFSFRESGFGIPTQSYYGYYNLARKKLEVIKKPYIEGVDYPAEAKLLDISHGKFVYALNLNVCTDSSLVNLSRQLSKNISRESNPILAVMFP